MMIVTGAAGFLGSCMISKLNQHNFNYIIAVDEFDKPEAEQNLYQKKIMNRIPTHQLLNWLEKNHREIEFIFDFNSTHNSTDDQHTNNNTSSLNVNREIWQKCIDYQIPLIFCSSQTSAKTDGLSSDISFEQWVLQQKKAPFFWAGITVPEVYGPNEYYLGKYASTIYRLFNQWQKEKNFGEVLTDQDRPPQDYVYVKDVVAVCYFLMHHRQHSGIYPLATGQLYSVEQIKEIITFILSNHDSITQQKSSSDIPILRAAGYHTPMMSLQEGASDYILNYLQKIQYY